MAAYTAERAEWIGVYQFVNASRARLTAAARIRQPAG